VVADQSSTTISILIGSGDGRFASSVSSGSFLAPFDIVAADFNCDGNIELVVSNSSVNYFCGL